MERRKGAVSRRAPLPRHWPYIVRVLGAFALIFPVYWISATAVHTQTRVFGPSRSSLRLSGEEAEKVFLAVPNAQNILSASRRFASEPHLAGSEGDYKTALSFLDLLHGELGIQPLTQPPIYSAGSAESRQSTLSIGLYSKPTAWIDVYYPYLSTPKEQRLEILCGDGKVCWSADLRERADETDEEAHKFANIMPAYHGLSAEGDVSGKLIYARWGRKQDYDALIEEGIDFTGSIVLVRNGWNFRGVKVELAQELGAVGVLMYHDPKDDGTVSEATGYVPYPHGPARNPTSVQRGAVQFLSLYPGDSTTPGYPSYKNATRMAPSSLPKIPSLPISWENAQVLLKTLEKDSNFFGKKIHLVNKVNAGITPIWNVMGVVPGILPDEVVIIGNHRDAWVLGTSDPSSGTASLHEIIRGLGVLLKKGWKPLRTIVIASWDAEEYGLIGSTEWGEDFSAWISKHVAAYLNLDSSATGSRLRTNASPLLAHLIRQAALDLPHPTRPRPDTLWDATSDNGNLYGNKTTTVQSTKIGRSQIPSIAPGNLGVGNMGSGSDYTVFLQHLGVSSTNVQFSSTLHDPVYHYHSLFDTHRWQQLYGDPGFHRHVAVSKHIGLQTLRLTSSIILPFNTTFYVEEMQKHVEQIDDSINGEFKVDMTRLRGSLRALHTAAVTLDFEKYKAELQLRGLLRELEDYEPILERILEEAKKVICFIGRISGHHCSSNLNTSTIPVRTPRREPEHALVKPRYGRPVGVALEYEEELAVDVAQWWAKLEKPLPSKYLNELRKAVKRVRKVNRKLIMFERGFISPEGLKGRKFYKHLGYAPGRFLGYGATPLPGLKEALTLDRNATLAQTEADRLSRLFDNISELFQNLIEVRYGVEMGEEEQ